ncbi:hypothetical protein LOTGIDRAFT_239537 [Lottia gigantea]|uniref:VWFA domain-containing protein n=1 Tax=Lottia gigantea TaxID=225164 RepID=V4AFZ2_LOTGI|nr:hypothetical protein LOTGIDRAFT_239537 [Lottia gigantea]ESO94075.1 hypothetical protein LOTGIDRAFT_239537 [Lottia gigantea]
MLKQQKMHWLLIFTVLLQHSADPVVAQDCNNNGYTGDVILLFDDSESTLFVVNDTKVYAPPLVAFLKQAISIFTSFGHHVALVSFSSTSSVVNSFTNDEAQLTTSIDNFQPSYKGSNLNIGVNVSSELFNTDGRSGLPKLLTIITDGISTEPQLTLQEISKLKQNGIPVLALPFLLSETTELSNLVSDSTQDIFPLDGANLDLSNNLCSIFIADFIDGLDIEESLLIVKIQPSFALCK